MNNKITKIFDNIGFTFVTKDNNFSKHAIINGFNYLSSNHIGYYIPYLARNVQNQQIETGVGEVCFNNEGEIVVTRVKIAYSSNNNAPVNFNNTSDKNEFYLFANQQIFDASIHNTIVLDKDYKANSVKSLYLADCTNQDINLSLPSASVASNIVVECKVIGSGNHHLLVRDSDNSVVANLTLNEYIKIASDGKQWIVVDHKTESNIIVGTQSSFDGSETVLQTMSNPQGDDQSLQYKSGNDLLGSEAYWDSLNDRMLIGSDSISDANIILPSSGNTIFNNSKSNGDFIVYGSGNRNLFFAYDGRLGINIPSGARPSTIFHVVNNICQEGFRLENRNSCHPANMTLYHKPSSTILPNSVVGQINLSAKDSNNNKTDYVSLEARAVDLNSPKGALDINVRSNNTDINIFAADPSSVKVGYSGINLSINNSTNLVQLNNSSSSINLGSSLTTVSSNSISLQGSNISIGSGQSNTNIPGSLIANSISSANIQSTTMVVPNIAPSSILIVDANNQIVGSNTLSANNLGTISLPIPANRFLTTAANGAITGIYNLDDYFLTEEDIIWNKYTPKLASVCLRQITFNNPVPSTEFVVGDQVVISSYDGNFYRTIVEVDSATDQITGLLLDQIVTQNTVAEVTVLSITQAGFLSMSKKVDNGIASDASQNILSIRPLTNTVFNNRRKDIDFTVYGIDSQPALNIKANVGRLSFQSGEYAPFATTESDVFPILINSSGIGLSNTFSSANFNYSSNNTNLFSGIVSDVGSNGRPSYYGTYDQNGNASEWVEKPSVIESRDIQEFVCGGSYITPISAVGSSPIGSSGLKHIESLVRGSGYNYVGFRIASLFNITDSSTITSANSLGLSFVNISDPQNKQDDSTTYLKLNDSYSPVIINDLGVVPNTYRIGRHEITNRQYCIFLNAVAQVNDRGLYDARMASAIQGGIVRVQDDNNEYVYTTKPTMNNKPVLFVSYISCIRFINWLHNGANLNLLEENIDYNLDIGAYNILYIGDLSYNIVKTSYRKYWLPNLNEWHKAAYYSPVDTLSTRGTSAVTVKRNEPFLVASGIEDTSKQPTSLFANLSVSGWLYVDHIIVGDGTIRSPRKFTKITQPTEEETTGQVEVASTGTIVVARTNLQPQWNNPNAIVYEDHVSCVSDGCSFNAKPLRLDQDVLALCSDQDLIDSNNTPWWCDNPNNGPTWFN
jgi:hypothetical protein